MCIRDRAITEEIAGADSRIAVLENDIAHNDATIASLKEEIGQSGLGREAIAAEDVYKRQIMWSGTRKSWRPPRWAA